MRRLWGYLSLGMSLSLALGCGSASPEVHSAAPHERVDSRPGIRLVLDDHLGWPYELSELTVLLDGELQYRRRGGPVTDPVLIDYPMTDVTPLGDEHTLQVWYTVRYQSGSVDSCEAGAEQVWSFKRTRPTARLTLALYTPGPTQSFDSLGLSLALDGATRRPLIVPTQRRSRRVVQAELDKGCARYSEPGQAVCRVQARLKVARADRDIVLFSTLDDKLTRMKALRTIAEKAAHRARVATSADEQLHQMRIEKVALAKIADEFESVRNGLICEYPLVLAGPRRWVSGPSCSGLAKLDPLPHLQACGTPGRNPLATDCWGQPPALR